MGNWTLKGDLEKKNFALDFRGELPTWKKFQKVDEPGGGGGK